MLGQNQVIPFLLEKCPEFMSTWEEHQRSISANVGLYIDVAAFVDFIMDAYEKGNEELLSSAFQAIEAVFSEGDSDAQQLAALGILETLQCTASWKPYGNKAFIQWLGPKSREAWDALVEIWRGKSSLMDVIRAENNAAKEKG